jgi:hypothetical protein
MIIGWIGIFIYASLRIAKAPKFSLIEKFGVYTLFAMIIIYFTVVLVKAYKKMP